MEAQHFAQRKVFCEWLLQQPQEFEQKVTSLYQLLLSKPAFISPISTLITQVLWSDEKWWVVKMKPNKQNDRFWAPINPHRYIESKEQGAIKVGK